MQHNHPPTQKPTAYSHNHYTQPPHQSPLQPQHHTACSAACESPSGTVCTVPLLLGTPLESRFTVVSLYMLCCCNTGAVWGRGFTKVCVVCTCVIHTWGCGYTHHHKTTTTQDKTTTLETTVQVLHTTPTMTKHPSINTDLHPTHPTTPPTPPLHTTSLLQTTTTVPHRPCSIQQ